jgi:Bifunctional DNA primase/polymerase, N-terminal
VAPKTLDLPAQKVKLVIQSARNLTSGIAGSRGQDNTPLEAALAYARSGVAVFPAPPGTKMSYKSARFNGGERLGATKDPAEIERDWARWSNANVCIVTGAASGLFVVETDTAAHGVDGAAALTKLINGFGRREWPDTKQALSPSGSRHYYFEHPPRGLVVRNSTGNLGPGIDVRGEGGMVVAPPSVRRDGDYRWANDAPIAIAPQWLLDIVAERPPRRRRDVDENQLVHWTLVMETETETETVKHMPTELEWHERNKIGMAIWACTGGSQSGINGCVALANTIGARRGNVGTQSDAARPMTLAMGH